jgi:hypothetical protein
MPDAITFDRAIYHEAGHGVAIEGREHKANILLEPEGRWDPTTNPIPQLPMKDPRSAEIAVAGPIAEALHERNLEEPDRITLPFWLDSPENINNFFHFGTTVIANRFHRTLVPVQLRLQFRDKTRHYKWITQEDYRHIPDEYTADNISALLHQMADEIRIHWSLVYRIATHLAKYKRYKTGGFAAFVEGPS